MGNTTNTQNWSARERLTFVERLAYWRGWVRRSDLCEKFGISVPQASADIAAYLRRNPRALRYDLKRKRYEALPGLRPTFEPGDFEEALRLCTEPAARIDRVARIDLPERHAADEVKRSLVRAVLEGESIAIYYYSIHSGREGWRVIRPHAFAHDGYRWHTRAWCDEDKAYKDFVLGRIAQTKPARSDRRPPPPDEEWQTKTVIRFQAHRDLPSVQRAALERDFGMKNGVGTLRVRKALRFYTLVYLGLMDPAAAPPRRLQLLSAPET